MVLLLIESRPPAGHCMVRCRKREHVRVSHSVFMKPPVFNRGGFVLMMLSNPPHLQRPTSKRGGQNKFPSSYYLSRGMKFQHTEPWGTHPNIFKPSQGKSFMDKRFFTSKRMHVTKWGLCSGERVHRYGIFMVDGPPFKNGVWNDFYPV